MKTSHRALALPGIVLLLAVSVFAQTPPVQTPAKDPSASVAGRVTIGGKPAPGITVFVATTGSMFDTKTVAKATTDEDGNYRITGLAAGSFKIAPIGKALAPAPDSQTKQLSQTVNVAEAEAITKVDFALVRGGVITGRVTDPDGNPIIGERVAVTGPDGAQVQMQLAGLMEGRNKTDDRGIYRIYGLSPGNYKVSVGQAAGSGMTSVMGMGGSQYLKTFYPGVQDEARATVLEVSEAEEVTNIDITAGKSASGFAVSGRVVDADSGQPVPNLYIAYSQNKEGELEMGGMSFTGSQSDANGKFRLENVKPGRYAAFTMAAGQANTNYSDPAPFEVSEGDVSGVEIKVRQGATISGVAVLENNFDPAAAALLKSVVLYAYVSQKGLTAPSYGAGKINADNSFQITGLAPGKARLGMQGFPTPPKGLTLLRTEVQGVDQSEGIEVAAGARVKDVRLVFAYGTGVVRGEIKIEGGAIPTGSFMQLSLRSPTGDSRKFQRNVNIDSRNHFLAEDIPPGNYELVLKAVTPGKDEKTTPPLFEPVTRTITVANGTEVQAPLVVNLTGRKAGN